jgi:hypothetical protein
MRGQILQSLDSKIAKAKALHGALKISFHPGSYEEIDYFAILRITSHCHRLSSVLSCSNRVPFDMTPFRHAGGFRSLSSLVVVAKFGWCQ